MSEQPECKRSWYLTAVGNAVPELSAETWMRLERIFELRPRLEYLDVQTRTGGFRVLRDFPSSLLGEVDRLLAALVRDDPTITGITLPATTEDKPAAEILAALKRGDLTLDEASGRLRQLSARV